MDDNRVIEDAIIIPTIAVSTSLISIQNKKYSQY